MVGIVRKHQPISLRCLLLQTILASCIRVTFAIREGKRCPGGIVSREYMRKNFPISDAPCVVMEGSLIFRRLNKSFVTEEIAYLKRLGRYKSKPIWMSKFDGLEQINGALIFEWNIGINSLWFLRDLKIINASAKDGPPLQISNNRGFLQLRLTSLIAIYGEFNYIKIYNRNRLPEGDVENLKNAVGKNKTVVVLEQWKFDRFKDNLGEGLIMIGATVVALAIFGYGSAYIVYLWEKKQALKEELLKASATPKQQPNRSKERTPSAETGQ
ncbi:hypothetical protein RB195_003889 [Necator americanus]|uniref:Receptor L-domain domain-containing protein n=1 Tax=Necator americanus TaxID=51031 RepID=A0ABR1DTE6_NECAM